MTPSIIVQIILFFVAFLARAFFAGSEIAFLSVDRLAVRNRAQSGHREAKRLDLLISDMQRLISIVLIGTNLTGTLSTVLATSITLELGLFGDNGVAVTTILMIFFVLMFGEILPKNYCGRNATALSLKITNTIEWCGKLFAPFVYVFEKLNKALLGKEISSDNNLNLTEESIKTMVTIGEEEGDVEETERDMIYGVFESSETLVREIMVPRVDMEVSDIEDGLGNVLDIIMETGYSRIPVYEDTIDNIIGIINAKDILEDMLSSVDIETVNLRQYLRDPYFVPETRLALELLHELREQGIHVAIVLDEYGGTEGLITLEDIIEEIVGEIQDEYDDELPEVVINENGNMLVDPRLSLDKVSEILDVVFDNDDVDTLSGLIYENIGRVPIENEEIIFVKLGIKVEILEVDGNKIERVKIIKLEEAFQSNIE